MKTQRRAAVRYAFVKSVPVMAGYIVLGIGFGILLRGVGYGALWAFAMSVLIYAGSMQYVGVSLIAGGASVLTTLLTTITVNARHLFYAISMIGRYQDAGRYKPYLIFALTDETYSLLCDGETPAGVASFTQQWLTAQDHLPAVAGLALSLVCLLLFGAEDFLIPAMLLITLALTLLRPRLSAGKDGEGGHKP